MNEQALKERLKVIATKQKKSFQEIWKLLLLERFLVRLSVSKYHNTFIFKGGLLLSHYLVIARETMDIDFLVKQLHVESRHIESMLGTICETKIEDGFNLSLDSIEELDHSHMNFPGYRARIKARFGKMKDRIQVDIGVGDVVKPEPVAWTLFCYRGKPIFEDSISLQVYPIETIFSEKLETIIARGAINSRMKDFHDILLLCRKESVLDVGRLQKSIHDTFLNRNTPQSIPIKFTEDDYARLQPLWSAHLRSLGNALKTELNLPDNLSVLVKEVNGWLERRL